MLRKLLTTTAVSAALATSAFAQTEPATPEADDETILLQPAENGDTEDETAADIPESEDSLAEDAATDETTAADEPLLDDAGEADALAEDPVSQTDPDLAEDEAADAPLMADEPADAVPADDAPALADDPAVDDAPAIADDPAADSVDEPIAAEGEPADATLAEDAAEDTPQLDLAGAMPVDLIGSEVRGLDDDQIATVDDVMTGPDGSVETILVRFGGFLGFGQTTVALLPEEVEVTRADDGEEVIVRTALTSDELRNRPAHEE